MNNLRKVYLQAIVGVCLIFTISGCDKMKEAANFDLLHDLPASQVIADSALYEVTDSEVVLLEQNITISIDSLERKLDIKKIEYARFDFIRLEAEIPDGSNLNWISQLSATVSGEGIGETEVGTYDGSKPDAKIIDLALKNAPITPYLLQEHFVLRIYGRVKPPLPASTTSILINSRIRITIQPV